MDMATTKHQEKLYIRSADLERVGRDLLIAHGLPKDDAQTVARCLVEADLRGVETHGSVRLPHYLNCIRKKVINPRPDLQIYRSTPVAVSIDGDDGFGFVIATRAMTEAIAMASQYGVGLASVKRSSHFGMAASYVLQAQRAGFMSLVFTNASRAMPPWGGRERLLGTSPFAAGAPSGTQPPFVLDMSPAVAARGKIRLAAKRGEQIPHGIGLDAEGNDTSDPNKIIDGGVVLPLGGAKGSAIAMMMDIFSGVFSGSAFAGEVTNPSDDVTRPQNVGHFIMAIKPDLFMPMAEFTGRMDGFMSTMKATPRARGFDEILIAGERGSREAALREAQGLLLPRVELSSLKEEADRFGIEFPPLSDVPLEPGTLNCAQ
jgi:LDH2 family malate/lactate/ureidoglycolate dehydrogenase